MSIIKLKGEDYPFLFAIKAQREMAAVDLTEKDDIYFIWLGLKYGSKADGKEFPFTEDALVDILEIDKYKTPKGKESAYDKLCAFLGEDMGDLKKSKTLAMKGLE